MICLFHFYVFVGSDVEMCVWVLRNLLDDNTWGVYSIAYMDQRKYIHQSYTILTNPHCFITFCACANCSSRFTFQIHPMRVL
jgi:hypothetical protein